jgi:pimeloyl-ACP methyl ester carboxylesterase
MTGWYGQMTGFSPAVVEEMRTRLEDSVGFCWDEIEPARLAASLGSHALVIHDRDDPELPASEGETLARAIPTAEFVVTEGLGHRRILRDPEVVEIAAGFVARTSSASDPTLLAHTNAASAA